MMDSKQRTILIKNKSKLLGFEACGISKAGEVAAREKQFLKSWLEKGLNAGMSYMQNHFDKRTDPTILVEGARSVISVVYNYFPKETINEEEGLVVSKYAYGTDYHFVLKDKLKELLTFIQQEVDSSSEGRVFVDSAPVLDRYWAAKSGVGWIGKNTNLIVPDVGSFVFIGELIISTELEYDSPITDRCGSCSKCISACPTNALVMPYLLDSNRCISFLTIENKEEIPQKFNGKLKNRIFGCDICQDVCPWNKKVKSTSEPAFTPPKKLLELTATEWQNLSSELFSKLFRKSAVKRTKYTGLKRNIDFVLDANPPEDRE